MNAIHPCAYSASGIRQNELNVETMFLIKFYALELTHIRYFYSGTSLKEIAVLKRVPSPALLLKIR